MRKLLIIVFSSILLAGCGNDTYDKALEQGKLALAKGENEKALGLFELALEEKPNDKEAKQIYQTLQTLALVQAGVENKHWDEALTKGNTLLKEKNLSSSIKKEIKQYLETAEAGKTQFNVISEKVETIKLLIREKKYKEAQKLISELKQDEGAKEALTTFSEEVDRLELTAIEEIKRQAAAAARIEAERKKNQISWKTYHNGRFGFTINYPKGWVLGPEPTNGDGRALYQGNDAEVVASGSNYREEYAGDISNYKKIKTNTGFDAFLLEENNGSEMTFDGLIINGEIEFHLSATMNQSFYNKYSDVLKKMFFNVSLDYNTSQ
ncbi:hypothetical protein KW850_21565 [Bacillus sp. sid0103]|uniref:hypothetical protein n=1 Tax=Bacillus sp. sid0103 TaxID=2856337 RepID=UPI001C486022|nr:hypothetical protein [Bacillus sp. sid0103]MBV7507822.1 hypothetical protein [Bacillus sp. sid0103]